MSICSRVDRLVEPPQPARVEATPTGHIVRWADHSWAEADGPSAVGVGRRRAEQLAVLVNVDLDRLLARERRP